jgi:hypothetical protein
MSRGYARRNLPDGINPNDGLKLQLEIFVTPRKSLDLGPTRQSPEDERMESVSAGIWFWALWALLPFGIVIQELRRQYVP